MKYVDESTDRLVMLPATFTYDPECNAYYFQIVTERSDKVHRTITDVNTNLDVDEEGNLLGVELVWGLNEVKGPVPQTCPEKNEQMKLQLEEVMPVTAPESSEKKDKGIFLSLIHI